MFDVFFHRYGP